MSEHTPSLIERLTAATGPSRELDRLIGDAVGAPMGYTGDAIGLGYARFTESLDAALTLVPEGWHAIIGGREKVDGWWHCALQEFPQPCRRVPPQEPYVIMAKTAALALCIAALRAREQQP